MIGPLRLVGVVSVVIFAGVADALPPKKIVGGTAAAPGEFPYMVSLRHLGKHFCGGAIVSPRHIVTAAHCFQDLKPYMHPDIYVATGSVFSNGGTNHSLRKIISHPAYDPKSYDAVNDIAVIVLAADIAFDENQTSLELPKAFVPEGVLANLTGWGHPDAQTDVIASVLMKISVKTLRANSCTNYFRRYVTIRNSQICTFGGRGVGACSFDSGGPLVYNGQLIGVVSFGMPCAQGLPDVFTSVYHHVAWIEKTMKE